VPVSDTIKEVVDGVVRKTVPRETLVEARGPWLFTREALEDALARAVSGESQITDLVGFCERAKLRVRVVLDQ
jgi:2-C-methyl-D-erythritol 4-phosphate cytidylyltransferase